MRTMAFKRSPEAAGQARRFVAAAVSAHLPAARARRGSPGGGRRGAPGDDTVPDETVLDDTVLDDTVLVASELVTNSVEHADDASVLWLRVRVSAAGVRLEVWDDGYAGIPHLRSGDNSFAEGGRGLQLVNELASRWGFWRSSGRTCCWAEITRGAPLQRTSGKPGIFGAGPVITGSAADIWHLACSSRPLSPARRG
jgi:anti-sigma regulatory factor (Ser/Thr protein kinase)